MYTSYFKNEETLNDASNFGPWKERLDITLEEHVVLEYVECKLVKPLENSNLVVKDSKGNIQTLCFEFSLRERENSKGFQIQTLCFLIVPYEISTLGFEPKFSSNFAFTRVCHTS